MSTIKNNVELVTEDVIKKVGKPVSAIVVVATLESFGIRDKDVFQDFGFVSLRELARYIYEDLSARKSVLLNEKEIEKKEKVNELLPISDYLWTKAKLLIQYYPLGLFHLLPILLQIVSIVLFGYSLWTYLGFNIVQSTAVVMGVILGLVLSGGYVQVMGRQASFYWHHGEFSKSKLVINKITKSAITGMLVTFVGIAAINFFLNLYPLSFILIVFMYAFLIGVLLLVTAPFHTLKERWAISVAITFATCLALALKIYTSLHIYYTHWIGIVVAIILAKIILNFLFKRVGATLTPTVKPKKLVVIYRNYPYFFYGVLIYVFVFIDRIVAWTADTGIAHRFVLLYEKDYEIGMDLAILVFFLLAGVLEYAIASFSRFMDSRQKETRFLEASDFNKKFLKMYWGHVILLLVSGLVISIIVYLIITHPAGYNSRFGEVLNDISIKTCIYGCLGYFFLAWGMLNSLYLFTLNRPNGSLKAIFIACIVNFGFGYVFSRWIHYEFSVVGMLFGAIVFMLLTLKENIKFFKNLDYHYYAAY